MAPALFCLLTGAILMPECTTKLRLPTCELMERCAAFCHPSEYYGEQQSAASAGGLMTRIDARQDRV